MTVHFEQQAVPISLLLDIVEVASSHSGVRLAAEFAQILDNFEVGDKVRTQAVLAQQTWHTGNDKGAVCCMW